MASLTHVCMWQNNGWKNITAEEAARLHPGGGVSAHSGLFMCELCGQYVLLTDGNYQIRHFRHSSAEKSKDCPERTTGAYVPMKYGISDHELPFRIRNVTKDNFEFEIGFIPVSDSLISRKNIITVEAIDYGRNKYIYSGERLNVGGVTYLSVGDKPSSGFRIHVEEGKEEIYKFWPKYNSGIASGGTVFDEKTGRKMVTDADVIVGKKYYILSKKWIGNYCSPHVHVNEISNRIISWETWRVYEVIANDYSEQSARFFLDYHCRLTESPIDIQPVWPVYVEDKYVVKHNKDNLYMHIKGNATNTLVFPDAFKQRFNYNDELVLKIKCNSRQQIVSAGRTKALNYAYFLKDSLNHIGKGTLVDVTDTNGIPVLQEENNILPDNGKIYIRTQYDGFIEISINNKIIEKRKIKSNKTIVFDGITWGMAFSIYVGLDMIKIVRFVRSVRKDNLDENKLLKKLNSFSGRNIKISHTAGSLANRLIEYPLIRKWLLQRIREGYVDEKAYKYLIRVSKIVVK